MLIYIFISLLGAAVYFINNFFYKILKALKILKSGEQEARRDDSLVIFSEGRIYWSTFKPIVEALLEREQAFTYLTLDIEDPALTIDNPYLDNRYIGDGSAAFARLGQSRAGQRSCCPPLPTSAPRAIPCPCPGM